MLYVIDFSYILFRCPCRVPGGAVGASAVLPCILAAGVLRACCGRSWAAWAVSSVGGADPGVAGGLEDVRGGGGSCPGWCCAGGWRCAALRGPVAASLLGLVRCLSADRGRLLGAPAAAGGVFCVVLYMEGFRAVRGLLGVLLWVCSTGWLRIVANIRPGGGYVTQRVTRGKPSDHSETLKTLSY